MIRMLKKNIPPSPVKCKLRLPILSIKGIVMSVMVTMMAPIPLVACAAVSSEIPALVNNLKE